MTSRFEWLSCLDVLKKKENSSHERRISGGGGTLFVAIWNKTLLYYNELSGDPGFECRSGRTKLQIVKSLVFSLFSFLGCGETEST
jgi:hypothetical protein